VVFILYTDLVHLRISIVIIGILAVIGVVSWFLIVAPSTPPASAPTLTPAEQRQNVDHLIEVRSPNVKDKLDQTLEQTQRYQGDYNNALVE
jgi:cytoskeletal protein RodZ